MNNKREIVIDEEMTGIFDLAGGDRMVEIGCVELVNGVPTGKTYHSYINPEGRPMSDFAANLTGLTNEFLAKQPLISTVAKDLQDFIGTSPIIVFCWTEKDGSSPDQNFLNNEMKRAGYPEFPATQYLNIRDWATKMYVLGEGSLNKMLDYYKIDRTERSDGGGHGGAIDAELTAKLYSKLKADWKKFQQKPYVPPRPPVVKI